MSKGNPLLAAKAKADVGNMSVVDLVTHAGGLPREEPFKQMPEKDIHHPMTVQALTDWWGSRKSVPTGDPLVILANQKI